MFMAQHFQNIETDESLLQTTMEEMQINTDDVNEDKITTALKSMKIGKAAAVDGIPAELLKAGQNTSIQILYRVLNNVWCKEEIPEEWNEGIIVRIPKKGDTRECGNWRGITLLCSSSKILAKIILQ